MADFGKDKAFAKRIDVPSELLEKNAYKQTTIMQGYYSSLEKQPVLNSTQIGHKPYQCDIKLDK